MVAPACFGITLPYAGSVRSAFWDAQLRNSRYNIVDGRVVSSGVVHGDLVLFAGSLFCPFCPEHFMYSWIRNEMQWRHPCDPDSYLYNCRVNRGEWSTGNFKFVFNETKGESDAFNFMNMRFPLKRTGIYTFPPGVTLKTLRFLYTLS
jgi:hypothetical protein